jgi:hypothetical protein
MVRLVRLRRLLVFFLLAWLPLQAAAVPLLALACHQSGSAQAAHAHAADADAHAGMHHHPDDGAGARDGEGDASTGPGHFCCMHFTALPGAPCPVAVLAPARTVSVVVLTDYSFYPELTRRPPRA